MIKMSPVNLNAAEKGMLIKMNDASEGEVSCILL
jgi:hypothetical protein